VAWLFYWKVLGLNLFWGGGKKKKKIPRKKVPVRESGLTRTFLHRQSGRGRIGQGGALIVRGGDLSQSRTGKKRKLTRKSQKPKRGRQEVV